MSFWEPNSWKLKNNQQYIHYTRDSPTQPFGKVKGDYLKTLPPLVHAHEIDKLIRYLEVIYTGEAFMVTLGDCAETFAEHSPNNIRDNAVLARTSCKTLSDKLGMPIINVGRVAGQFAKPRTNDVEELDRRFIPVYRGDMINSIEQSFEARLEDPERMIMAYHQAAFTLNFLRSHYAESQDEFFTSHEALHLPYEEGLTRAPTGSASYYNTSAHMVWIGERTRDPDCAHVEFCRGIVNPVGVKVGPAAFHDAHKLVKACKMLRRMAWKEDFVRRGPIVLIVRMGTEEIERRLPPLMQHLLNEGVNPVWVCDPMHGNTIVRNDKKTRVVDTIIEEVTSFNEICLDQSQHMGGIHLESSAQDILECIDHTTDKGPFADKYLTHCDPRLNSLQVSRIIKHTGELLCTN